MADRWLVDKTTGKLLVDENGYPLAVDSEDIGGGSGYIEAALVPSNTDINTYRGENYWGKTFYAGGSNTVQNTPIAGIAFSLEVLRSGAFATVQRISILADVSNNRPTVFTRSVSDTTVAGGEGTWTAWTEVAEANGTYPNMTVGKAQSLSRTGTINAGGTSATTGWYKFATIPYISTVSTYNYSGIILVNGSYGSQATGFPAESGIIEVDVRTYDYELVDNLNGVFVLAGNIIPTDYCIVNEDDNSVSLYVRVPDTWGAMTFTTLSEYPNNIELLHAEYEDIYYGSTAPSGAVYAVRRNIASQSEKDIETISASGTTFTFGFADDTSKNVTVVTDELEEVELSDVMPSTNILSNTTFGRTGVDNSVTTFSNYAAKYSQINAVYMYSIGSDGSPIASGSNNISIQDSVRYGDIRLVYTNTSTQGLKILRPISITQGIGLNANAFTILFIDYNDDSGSFVPYACLYSITTGKFSNLPAITGYNLSGMAVEGILPYVSST